MKHLPFLVVGFVLSITIVTLLVVYIGKEESFVNRIKRIAETEVLRRENLQKFQIRSEVPNKLNGSFHVVVYRVPEALGGCYYLTISEDGNVIEYTYGK